MLKKSNREMHVDYENNITLDVVALKTNKSLRTIKTIVKRLIEENKLVREGSKKTGKWIVK